MTRRGRVMQPAALLCCAVIGCTSDEPRPYATPVWHAGNGYRWHDLAVPRTGRPGFTAMPQSRTGIRFENAVSDSLLERNRLLGQGAGVALGDVDGDGLVDVFLARTEGPSALYRNTGGWRFEDVTAAAGVATTGRFSSGCSFVDVDGDGDLDLLLLATRGPNAIFVNDGGGRFTERRDLGLDTIGRGGTTPTMGDVDGDGDLDLYIANYKPFSIDDSIPPERRSYSEMIRQVSPGQYEIAPEQRAHFKIVFRPDMGGLRATQRGEPDEFYLNQGGRFERVPLASSRFRSADGRPLAEESESFTLAARFADLNADGAPDLYVANDFEDTDELWFNDGRGNYRLADWRSLRQLSHSAMGLDIADVNGDARPDLFVLDMLSSDRRRLKTQTPAHTAITKRPGDGELQLQQQRNTLYINRGDETFVEAGLAAGVAASGWSWATLFMDVDLDGWQDILVANGHLWDIMDGDTHERLRNNLDRASWRRSKWEFPSLKLRNVAFRNRGGLAFEDATASWRFGIEDDVSHAMAAADLDGDGDLDVVVNRLGSPALVLRNDATAARVAVRLIGSGPNTRAVGAVARLENGAVPLQVKELAAGGLYLSHSDYLASFAMGGSDSATLVVDWRDGSRTIIEGIRANNLYEVSQDSALASQAPVRTTAKSRTDVTLFEDVTPRLRGHVHVEEHFDDWQHQLLLPNSMSQLGPGVAWFDYDRDGDEDLAIGTGKGGRVALMRNDRGRFSARMLDARSTPADFTSLLGLSDAAGARLLVGVSSWERQPMPAALAVSLNANLGQTNALLPTLPSATGPMALSDYDRDGDLDLFIGGRAVPRRYPLDAASYLYRNTNGSFSLDSDNSGVLDDVGMVSAAVFADVDGDGDGDLVLAREWDSILLLLNEGGRFAPAPETWGLTRLASRWNGITAGDVNGDGLLDLVATSWGRNTMTQASHDNPLVLLSGAFGAAGEVEMLLAQKDESSGDLVPLNSYPRVRLAVSGAGDRVRSFGDYARADVSDVLGSPAAAARRREVNTLDHTVFLNQGSRFEARSLPLEAQLAPAFYVGVSDFDGDGYEDVFLAQNFYPTAPGLPRYDTGRGLLLLGDGSGGLTPLDAGVSGIRVYGDQRGAAYADFDGDARLDLVITQNGDSTRLLRNRAARQGLRVRVTGPPSNPDAVGAQLRVLYDGREGPVREIMAGSGYWSQNGAVQVFGLNGTPRAVRVRWPGGGETVTNVPPGAREVVVRR